MLFFTKKNSSSPFLNSDILIISLVMFFSAFCTENHEYFFMDFCEFIAHSTNYLGLSFVVEGSLGKSLEFFLFDLVPADNRTNLLSSR